MVRVQELSRSSMKRLEHMSDRRRLALCKSDVLA